MNVFVFIKGDLGMFESFGWILKPHHGQAVADHQFPHLPCFAGRTSVTKHGISFRNFACGDSIHQS